MSATTSRRGSARTVTAPPARRLAQRVLDEVRGDLEQPVGVGLDPRLLRPRRASATPNSRAAASCAARPPRARPRRGRPARCATENSLRFIRARSSRSRTSRSSRRASTQDRPRGLVGVERAVGEALGVAADRRQRRLQLVAHREQEVALGLARRGELLGHLVERLRERGELARALARQRLVALARPRARGSRRRRAGSAGRSSARRRTRARRRAPRRRAPASSRSPRNGRQAADATLAGRSSSRPRCGSVRYE